jgi:hypothetical protein
MFKIELLFCIYTGKEQSTKTHIIMSKLVIGHRSLVKACLQQYRMVREKSDRTIQIAITGDDPTEFVFKIEYIGGDNPGDEGYEFQGGQYIGRIHQKSLELPPSFEMWTPNGVMSTDTESICVSISKYHSQNYRAELGLYGYLVNIVVAMLCWKETKYGIGLKYNGDIRNQVSDITMCAASSHEWNLKHRTIELDAIADQVLTQSLTEQLDQLQVDDEKRQEQSEVMKETLAKKAKTKRGRPVRSRPVHGAKKKDEPVESKEE